MSYRHPHSKITIATAKRVIEAATAICAVAGALVYISHATHWLDGLVRPAAHGSSPAPAVRDRSPVLGVSFYQNGQLVPMSDADPGTTGANFGTDTLDVSMKDEPFELWFPSLSADASLAVCASDDSTIINQNTAAECLSPGNAAADSPYGSGLWPATSANLINTAIGGTRVQPASNGDQKYYVGNITSTYFHGSTFYLAIGRDNGMDTAPGGESFVLTFSGK